GGGVRGVGPVAGVAFAVGGEQDDQHVVRGAEQRDGPAAERAEAAQELWLLTEQEDARLRDVLRVVQLQLLLGCADDQGQGSRGQGGRGGRRWRPASPSTSGRSANGSLPPPNPVCPCRPPPTSTSSRK